MAAAARSAARTIADSLTRRDAPKKFRATPFSFFLLLASFFSTFAP